MKKVNISHKLIVGFILVYLLIPLIATFLYSISTDWYRTVLPEGYTFQHYIELFSDVRFVEALQRTLLIAGLTIVISVVVILPTIFIISIYFPKVERIVQSLVMLPYAVPPVVAAVGLIKIYSQGPLILSGTIWILIGAYFVITLPYMFHGIRNSMRTVDSVTLIHAAELLGASKIQAIRRVIVPNILPGLLVSVLLSFSVMFGEFVLANLLLGGQYELIQVYLWRRMNENGHLSSAIVVTYFILIVFISAIVLKLGKTTEERGR